MTTMQLRNGLREQFASHIVVGEGLAWCQVQSTKTEQIFISFSWSIPIAVGKLPQNYWELPWPLGVLYLLIIFLSEKSLNI